MKIEKIISNELLMMELASLKIFEGFLIHMRTCEQCKTDCNKFMKKTMDCKNFLKDLKKLEIC